MDAKLIATLSPTAETAAAIQAAITRILAAREAALGAATKARAERATNALTATSAQRRALADLIDDSLADAEQCALMAAALEGPLDRAKATEYQANAAVQQAKLKAELAKQSAKFDAEYPALHEKLEALMAGVRAVASEITEHNLHHHNYRVDAACIENPVNEIRLLKTPEQRAYDSVPHHVRVMQAEDARRRAAIAARGPNVMRETALAATVTQTAPRDSRM